MSEYLFGYGSLMNMASAERVVGRQLSPAELTPAWLNDYERTWSLKERVFSEVLQQEVWAVFLDLTPRGGRKCNGVLLAVTSAELERARQREKNYAAVDVTAQVTELGSGEGIAGRVITFVARPEFRTGNTEGDAWVLRRYVELVDTACAALGEDFQRSFAASTRPPAYPVLDGRYTFVDSAQAKLV